jgi:drug/metabolite transporter (DMT)-like permease
LTAGDETDRPLTIFITTTLIALLAFREAMGWPQFLGISLIIGGIVLVAAR